MKIQKSIKLETFIDEVQNISIMLLKNTKLIPREEYVIYSYLPLLKNDSDGELNSDNFYRFRKVSIEHDIIGVDASIIPIAESEKGYVFGLRGAAVKYDHKLKKYIIYIEGPFILYLTADILEYFRGYLNSRFFINDLGGVLNYMYAKKVILNVYEWLLVRDIVNNNQNTIIILDGVVEPKYLSSNFYKGVIRDSYDNQNYVVGISKRSRYLKYFSELTSSLLYIGMEGMISINIPGKRYSRVFIGLLRKGGYPFRIDILKDTSPSIMNEIYSSNLNIVGYPEVLKEAHVFSKLTRKDSLLLKAIMARKGIKIKYSEPYREIIMGVLEHWGEGNEAL